jgi:two-component system CheB/CheR fusion protein
MDRPAPRSLSVLVADDQPDAADSLAEALRSEGHAVTVAYGGAEALQALDGWVPDVALVNLMMPQVSGFQVAGRLRRAAGKRPLLIAVTGLGRKEDFERTQAAGFDRHLLKPVDPRVLADLLRDYADRRG